MAIVILSSIIFSIGIIYVIYKYIKKEKPLIDKKPTCCETGCCNKEICTCKDGICCHVPELHIDEKIIPVKKIKKAVKKVAPKKKKGK
jgi:hypothetical protein